MRPLLVAALVLGLAGCGGSSSGSQSSETTPSSARPVRVDDPGAAPSDEAAGPRPVRVAPTVPGEAAESEELADPPPVEPPTT